MKPLLKLQFFSLLLVYLFFGLIPQPGKIIGVAFNDLVVHFAGYAVLFLSAKVAFPGRDSTRLLFLLLFGYSILIEVMQHFVPRRTFDVADMLANGMGLLVGFCAYAVWIRLVDRSSRVKAER